MKSKPPKPLLQMLLVGHLTTGPAGRRRDRSATHGNLANEIHDLLAGFAFERVPEFERAVDEGLELRIGV